MVSPARMFGALVSFSGHLWLYGGVPINVFFDRDYGVEQRFYKGTDYYMMKLNMCSHLWEPVSNSGLPHNAWERCHSQSVGMHRQWLLPCNLKL